MRAAMTCHACGSPDLERDQCIQRGPDRDRFFGVRYFCQGCGEYFFWSKHEGLVVEEPNYFTVPYKECKCAVCGQLKPVGETCLQCED